MDESGEVNKGIVYDTYKKITQAGFDSCSTKMVPSNAVVIALAGQGKTRGTVARTRISLCTNQSLCSIICNESVTSDFLYYFLSTQYQQLRSVSSGDGTRGGLNLQMIRSYCVPVPPMKIQHEIVNVLDTFTKLEAELEAELEARRRQYKYYRDALLAFGDQDVRWATMAEVGEFIRGRRFTKADYVEDGVGCIHYGEIYTHYGISANEVISQVRPEMKATLRFAKPGDVVITDVGETVEDVGKAVAWIGTEEVAIHDHCYAFRHSMNPKFVSYCMHTTSFIAEKAKYVARTKVNTLLMDGFSKIRIPVPPLDEQERIVTILDKFDALVNDLGSGLPAEIKARRQQYEHYRNRLLSFREAA
ncbi:restriction endonuclease subunit S [Geotalea toluenoxydans]|uniref:restriction endonuclease subunit S n=1 Tax=Geotalea toluenoxydans TaxID=421624 RepID=UPI000AFDDFBA|nr:restriction endonuclease subunit S [Geotalea toluenoxydans]